MINQRTLIQRCILAAFLTVALAVPAWADFEEAAEAFKRGDYETAYCELRLLAKKGHPVAQFHLGFLYDTGQGVQQDYDKAIKWYRRSARQGYFEAVKWRRAAQQGPWRPMPAGFVTVSRQSFGTEQTDALSKPAIRQMQGSLARLGHDPGPLDGLMGPRTRRAIRAYEIAKGQRVDGEASAFLVEQLLFEEQLRLLSQKAN